MLTCQCNLGPWILPCELQSLRTIALRKDTGRFIGDPQEAYLWMSSFLQDKQVGVEDVFWCDDPGEYLVHFCFALIMHYTCLLVLAY